MSLPLWFRVLPRAVRRRMYTSRLGYKPRDIEGLTFKIAESRDEWQQAFALAHDVAVQSGFYSTRPSGMRIASYNALPSTAVFVAKHGDEVVGTMTLVEDSPLGLPMEPTFPEEINRYRVRKRHLAEVSALAVKKAYRGIGMTMTMNRTMWRWAYFYRKVKDLVIAVRTHIGDYYRSVLLFEQIGPPRPYTSLNNTPVVAMRLDLETAVERYHRTYGEKPQPGLRNVYRFMVVERDITAVHLPKRLNQIWVETDAVPPLTLDDLRYFFVEQEQPLASLHEGQRRYLERCYSELDLSSLWRQEADR